MPPVLDRGFLFFGRTEKAPAWEGGRYRDAGSGGKAAVLAAVEEEGFAVVAEQGFDLAEEDSVVAGEMFRDEIAGEVGQRVFQQGNAAGCPEKADAELLVESRRLIGSGEMLGERLLIVAEDADAKAALRFQEREQAGVLIHADENEVGIEGNRGERVCSHAVDFAGFAFNGDDRDASGKSTGDAAEHLWVRGGEGHRVFFFKITQQTE
jgi:hypothetical protein